MKRQRASNAATPSRISITVDSAKATGTGSLKPTTWSTLEPEKKAAFRARAVVPRAAG